MTYDIIMITNYSDSKIMFIIFYHFICFLFIFHYSHVEVKENIWEPILCFHCVDSKIEVRSPHLEACSFTQRAISLAPSKMKFKKDKSSSIPQTKWYRIGRVIKTDY